MSCTFTEFAEKVRRENLTPKDCGNNHWRILGGASLVNFYPSTKRGPRMYIDGSKAGSRRSVTVADAIAAANAPPAKTKRQRRGSGQRRVQQAPWEQDAGSNETRKRGDAMKAEEFKETVLKFLDAITDLDKSDCCRSVWRELNAIWWKLDQHRLEMEAAEEEPDTAEEEPDTATCPGDLIPYHVDELPPRIDEIEKRLDEFQPVIDDHRNTITHQGLVSAYNELVLRLDEIPASFRKALTAHFYDQRERIGKIEKRLTEIERKAAMHVHGTAVYLTGGQAADAG